MLENTMGQKPRSAENAMDVDEDDLAEEDRVAQQQTAKLQEMAKKVEDFVEGKGDLEGATFEE